MKKVLLSSVAALADFLQQLQPLHQIIHTAQMH